MYRFAHIFRRFSTGIEQKETFLEHLNTNGKSYSIMGGLIGAGLAGLHYMVGLQMKPLQVEIKSLEKNMNEMKTQLKQDMKELKDLLTPLLVQVQVNQQRFDDLNKKLST